MPRWLIPVALLVCVVMSAWLLIRTTEPGAPSVVGLSPPLAPVLSARRLPTLLSRLVADGRLRSQLDAALSVPALGAARDHSCLVVRQGQRTVFSRHPEQRLIPASNLKVLTAIAVLARLGPESHLVTEVRAGGPLSAGVVDGPLWLVGGGDPLLSTSDYAASFENQPQTHTSLEALADGVVAAGIRVVNGGVVGDESRYDTQRYLPTWKRKYITDSEVGPASALLVNDGFVEFLARHTAATEPDVHAANTLTVLLQARGVTVNGGPGEGTVPANATAIARVESPPMRDVVAEMLRESDNMTAEMLLKEVGFRSSKAGTTAGGLEAMRASLGEIGLPVADLSNVDGSGLDRSDLTTCDLLLRALDHGGRSGIVARSLPVAGRDGTLAKRFLGTPAVGRLQAKTGSLDGVAGLTGYVDAVAGGVPLGFSLLANDLARDEAGRVLQEQVGQILARYPDAPPADTLAP